MKHRFLIIIFTLILSSVSAQKSIEKLLDRYNSHSIPYISVEELKMFQNNEKPIIFDVREPQEFAVSHLKNSINIDYETFTPEEKQIQNVSKNADVIVYCSVGIRSEKMGEKLKKAGFTNVKNLYGGIFEWKNKGNSVVDSMDIKTENIHTYSKKWSEWLHAGNPIY